MARAIDASELMAEIQACSWDSEQDKERDAALLSLDEEKIKGYCRKYGVPIPSSDKVFWLSVHKAICNITSASTEQRRRSAQWLVEHGSTPEI